MSFTPNTMWAGNDDVSEWVNGRYFNVKVWDAALTQAELMTEMNSITPKRRANLHLWSPLWRASDTGDYSGAGRNWTVGGTLTDFDNAPVGYGGPLQSPLIIDAGGGATEVVARLAGLTTLEAPVLTRLAGIGPQLWLPWPGWERDAFRP